MNARKILVVGLGNPGPEFEDTYHNIGMLAVRAIAAGSPFKAHKKLFSYAAAGGTAFVIPLVFMNESGRAVAEAMKKFGARPADLIVIHDDSDLPIGAYKLSIGRGAAGHKGVASIIRALGTDGFTRIRIGIRNPREKRRKKAGEFVLKKIAPRDRAAFKEVFASL
jgi:peptidyl-tRNA hydrolase, PTH1 family